MIRLHPLAYTAALLPLFTIHLCYFLAAGHGHVEWCNPYLDSCSSISAAGRQPPEFFVFKGLMIPAAVLLFLYWLVCERWLTVLAGDGRRRSLVIIGAVASAGLILYSVMLGAIGDIYQLQRRIGVILFFGLSYIAQLLVNTRLSHCETLNKHHSGWLKALTLLSLTILIVGAASVVWSTVDEDYYDTREDAFEWTVTLLLCCHVLVTARLWQLSGFRMTFGAGTSGS